VPRRKIGYFRVAGIHALGKSVADMKRALPKRKRVV
jgi:hypothetical protein